MLPGYEHFPRQGVGAFTGGGNKLLLHTTEGRSFSGAFVTLDKNRSWSHFLLSFEEKRKAQFIEIGQGAKSLSNNAADGYQTNKANVVQVEICGYSNEAPNWSTAKLDWLAQCFSEIRQAWNFPLNHLDFKVPATRLSDKAFVDYAGITGHQHCPDNDHWDPGALNVPYIVSKMKGGNVSADKLTKEEVIELHVAFNDGPPGSAYDWRHVGGPLSDAIRDFKPGIRGRLTKPQVEKLHKAILGGAPGAGYDWRHVGGKIQAVIDDWIPSPIALHNRTEGAVAGKDTKLVEAGTGGFDKEKLYTDQIAATKKVFGK